MFDLFFEGCHVQPKYISKKLHRSKQEQERKIQLFRPTALDMSHESSPSSELYMKVGLLKLGIPSEILRSYPIIIPSILRTFDVKARCRESHYRSLPNPAFTQQVKA